MRTPSSFRWVVAVLVLGGLGSGAKAFAAEPAPPPVSPVSPASTDHDSVVRRWGVEARRVATVQRTPGQDPNCGNDCSLDLNAFGVRRWLSPRYAYSAGLVLALGGGSLRARQMDGSLATDTWDTYFGFGPTVGANFLLANWKHLAVSASPQMDVVYFLPASSRGSSYILNLRGLIEGEIHLGFIGLPQLTVALSTGLAANFLFTTKPSKPAQDVATASDWSIGTAGPTSLWGLVTNAAVRFYF